MNSYTRPNSKWSVLLTIDVQNDFTLPDGNATIEGTGDCLPNLKRLTEDFREHDRPIVHVVRLYRRDGSNVDISRREMIERGQEVVRPGTQGAELVYELKPNDDVELNTELLLNGDLQSIGEREWVMYKPRWGAFYETPLESHLDELSVDTLVVAGCNFPNCPRTTIYEASERDFKIIFVPDATSGTYQRGLNELEDIGVSLRNTGDILNQLE